MSHNTEPEGTMRTQVELPDSLWEGAKKHCIDARITLKELLTLSVREYLDRLPPRKKSA